MPSVSGEALATWSLSVSRRAAEPGGEGEMRAKEMQEMACGESGRGRGAGLRSPPIQPSFAW